MKFLRKANERGYAEVGGWLKSFHTFSFSEYYDPRFMGYRNLRVINQDWIAKGGGFPLHPHRDMEIITYVLDGIVEHRDSLGNIGQITAGEIQTMHAGTGVRHSEYNPSQEKDLQLFQIWIMPDAPGVEPGYTQQSFTREQKVNRLCLLVSKQGRDGSQMIHQDVDLYASILEEGKSLEFAPKAGRGVWLQMAKGELVVNGETLTSGDAIALEEEELIKISANLETEFLLFDMA